MFLHLERISKSFPRKQVLKDISLDFETGKIYALYGENGAGKSTLASIISGEKKSDSGTISREGKIAIVNQHPVLNDELTIYEHAILVSGLKRKVLAEKIKQLFEDWNFSIDLKLKGKKLSSAQRFYASFLLSLLSDPDFLILDEPTVFLDIEQRNMLYECIKANTKYSEKGLCVILISHFASEIFSVCDSVILLKDGVVVSKNATLEMCAPELNKALSFADSQENESEIKNLSSAPSLKNVLSVQNLSVKDADYPNLYSLNFSVERGKIVLIYGQREAGLETLEEILSGMKKVKYTGKVTVTVNEKGFAREYEISPDIRKMRRNGVSLVPSNRMMRGANPGLTVSEFLFPLDEKMQEQIIRKADVNCTTKDFLSTFSGGMIQRLILERELYYNNDTLFLFECDQGLDTRSRIQLAEKLKSVNEQGKSILLLTSSGEEELKEIAHSIYSLEGGVLKRGEK